MFNLVKKILGKTSGQKGTNSGEDQDAHVALCVLLLEAAHVDGQCSAEEIEHIKSTLIKEYGVPRQGIDKLIAASQQQRNDAVDLFHFTRYMNENFTKDQKIAVMEAVWRIIHVDAQLEAHEDHFAHKLANLLRLTHTELIDAKIRAKKQLS